MTVPRGFCMWVSISLGGCAAIAAVLAWTLAKLQRVRFPI